MANLIYLWSREFVQDRIYSNTINLSLVSRFLDITAVECIFLCGSTAVPEERKPPVRRKETVKPEQGYRT